jgi:hypothetical protein
MNFIKIPQLLIAILLVAFSLSNAFAAGEEEIIAFIASYRAMLPRTRSNNKESIGKRRGGGLKGTRKST